MKHLLYAEQENKHQYSIAMIVESSGILSTA